MKPRQLQEMAERAAKKRGPISAVVASCTIRNGDVVAVDVTEGPCSTVTAGSESLC